MLIISNSIARVELRSLIHPVRLKGAKLCTPKSFSCKQAVVEAIEIAKIANLFNFNETQIIHELLC